MSVLSRPLFRQAGGPAQPMPQDMAPPPMPPPMPSPMAAEQMMANAPPPEMAMLEQAEAGATAQGQELGAAYAEQMMAGIDGAQSTEDLINALRGNDKPLDARRDELAGLVGKADANQTPESVLAMVQPVIMMTEEGMMDSGIGALVQQITGDVEMTTADGAPTEMGMGVGSLMAAGAQEAPAPQNFRQGGEVAHLQDGSNPVDTAPAMSFSPLELEKLLSGRFSALASENVMSFGDAVKGRYEDLLPLYQEILGADQESKDATKAQMLFDVAQGGLQLAAGVPGVGSSFASQFAGAAAPVAGRIQERGAALEQERRGIKQGALEGAIRQTEREMDFQQDLAVASARAGRTKPNFKMVTDLTTGQKMYVDVNTSEGASVVQSATAANATSPTGNLFAVNTLSSESLKNAKSFLVNGEPVISFDGGRTYTGEDGLDMEMPNNAIPLSDENAANILSTVAKRSEAAAQLKELLGTGSEDDIVQANVKAGTADEPVALTNADRSALSSVLAESQRDPVAAAKIGTGFGAQFDVVLDNVFAGPLDSEAFQDTQTARQYLKGITVLGRSALVVNPRFPVAEMENVATLFPDVDSFFKNPITEANKLIEMKRLAKEQLLRNLDYIATSAPTEQLADVEANNKELKRLLGILESVPETYGSSTQQNAVIEALRSGMKGK